MRGTSNCKGLAPRGESSGVSLDDEQRPTAKIFEGHIGTSCDKERQHKAGTSTRFETTVVRFGERSRKLVPRTNRMRLAQAISCTFSQAQTAYAPLTQQCTSHIIRRLFPPGPVRHSFKIRNTTPPVLKFSFAFLGSHSNLLFVECYLTNYRAQSPVRLRTRCFARAPLPRIRSEQTQKKGFSGV